MNFSQIEDNPVELYRNELMTQKHFELQYFGIGLEVCFID